MILASLTIRDYKQFAGEHTFEPDRQGITAVIGPNGAGKTTLFEAIEWCLYGPRSISNADVLPRGLGGMPLVRITLEEPRTGKRFVVERRLSRSKVMQADVWDEANPGDMLATGSAPVKKFVSEQMIGLGHAAFISTFFTRQKELSFFGALGDTKRRKMVGQMIGVEAVRIAQEAIGDERTKAAATAEAIGAMAEQDNQDRDLPAELALADAALNEANELVLKRTSESARARQALETANAEAERIRLRAEQDRQFAAALSEHASMRGKLEARIEALDADLARMAHEATRRDELVPIAELAPERQAVVEHWSDRQRVQLQIDERQRSLAELRNQQSSTIESARKLIASSTTRFLPAWTWNSEADPASEFSRLLTISTSLTVDRDRERLNRFEQMLVRQSELDRAEKQLESFQKRLDGLRADEARFMSAGDPGTSLTRLRAALDDQRALVTRHESEQKQARDRARQLDPLLRNLQERTFDDHCPTCGRSINEHEAADVIAAIREQVAGWNEIAAQRALDADQARLTIRTLESDLTAEQSRAERLTDLRNRLANGQELTRDKAEEVERQRMALTEARAGHDTTIPSEETIRELRVRVDELAAVSSAAQGVAQRAAQLQELMERERAESAALSALGAASYDANAHRSAIAELDASVRARTTIENIDRDLARRPTIAAQRDETGAALQDLNVLLHQIETERAALGYTESESIAVRAATNDALETDRQATAALHLAQSRHREHLSEINRIREEQRRIEQQLARSASLRREADQLGEMYKEFALFDQYVAARVAPRLAEQTSELIEIATDGKFTSVDFDENYGIHVYDGINEKFPLESFSGGERDVVALCARLALSQMIGSSAAHPPSFLVLDEVFGALDRDRRMHLLELLGRISESIDAFQQMFIISHVDDVRSSPIFTRVIRVTESANGASQIEDLSSGTIGED
jgi:exonuclease SbcC